MRPFAQLLLLLALLACGVSATVRAEDGADNATPALKDPELVANSDLIVVAVVNKVRHLTGVPDWAAGELTLKVVQVIKGKQKDLEWVTVRHANSPKSEPGEVTADHSGMAFKAGQRRLFFLADFLDSYQVVGDAQGVRQESDADKYAELAKKEIATIAVEPIEVPSATMGDLISVTCEITNNSTTSLNVFDPQLGGYYLELDKKTPHFFMAHDDTLKAKASLGQVPAGGKLRVTVQLKAGLAAKDIPAKGAAVPVRLKVYLKPLSRDKNDGFYIQSPAQTLTIHPAVVTAPIKPKM